MKNLIVVSQLSDSVRSTDTTLEARTAVTTPSGQWIYTGQLFLIMPGSLFSFLSLKNFDIFTLKLSQRIVKNQVFGSLIVNLIM